MSQAHDNEDAENGGEESTSFWEEDVSMTELAIAIIVFGSLSVAITYGAVGYTQSNPTLVDSPLSSAYTDTDGDGLSDIAEKNDPQLAGASPDRMDVFIEVDYVEGTKPTQDELDVVRQSFNNISVENPDGTTGVQVHIVVDDKLPNASSTSIKEVQDSYKSEWFDRGGYGYHYVVITPDAVDADGGDDRGGAFTLVGKATHGLAIVESDYDTGYTFTHEMGHAIGINPRDSFEGVDSRKYACNEDDYQSVMNYNCRMDDVSDFSSDESKFNDGEWLQDNIYTPSTTTLDIKYLGDVLP